MLFHNVNRSVLAIAIIAFGWMSLWSQTSGAPSIQATGSSERLEVIPSMLPNGIQQIVVVDSASRTMAVYQIEPAQGKLQLKSVRNLTWDLAMEQYNGVTPLPSELRLSRPGQ